MNVVWGIVGTCLICVAVFGGAFLLSVWVGVVRQTSPDDSDDMDKFG
jgi:hypothetical protein